MPNGGEFSFDASEMPDSGEFSFDAGEMPDGGEFSFDASEMPENGDFSFDAGEMLDSFGGFSMGGNGANLNYTDDDLDSYSAIWDGEVTDTGDKDHRRVVKALENIAAGTDLEQYMDIDNLLRYMAGDAERFERLLEYPDNIKTPIVRNGRRATVGYQPEVWKDWE